MQRGRSKPVSQPESATRAWLLLDRDERQLRFAHKNGQRVDRSAGVGGLLKAEFAKRCAAGPAWRRRLVAVIEEHAGDELLANVEGIELRRGVLRLEVAESSVRYELGMRWQQRLLAMIQAHVPGAGVSAVRFVNGR